MINLTEITHRIAVCETDKLPTLMADVIMELSREIVRLEREASELRHQLGRERLMKDLKADAHAQRN